MSRKTPMPFAAFEWMIAWRYLRARRAEGGVSVMTWISLIGITLAVFALIATLAVRSGFRAEFVDTILGANAHITLYETPRITESGGLDRQIYDYDARTKELANIEGVLRVAPLVKGQVMATVQGRNSGVEVFGIRLEDLRQIPRIGQNTKALGSLTEFGPQIAIGSGVAQNLGVSVGDKIKLISPEGAKTAFGTSPRVKSYEIGYIFSAGRYDIDRTRIYMPFAEAQTFFNRGESADELELIVQNPEKMGPVIAQLWEHLNAPMQIWTWQDASSNFLRALEIEDNVMFVILAILVLIATMNIVSGLIMLVKNKGRDIGILRTMGLSEGTVLRVFFLCGALTGVLGTIFGVLFGCLFAIYIDSVFSFVNYVVGGGVWDPSIRGLYSVPAKLEWDDVGSAILLSLGLSFGVTYFPARRAARLNPVEALRYE